MAINNAHSIEFNRLKTEELREINNRYYEMNKLDTEYRMVFPTEVDDIINLMKLSKNFNLHDCMDGHLQRAIHFIETMHDNFSIGYAVYDILNQKINYSQLYPELIAQIQKIEYVPKRDDLLALILFYKTYHKIFFKNIDHVDFKTMMNSDYLIYEGMISDEEI